MPSDDILLSKAKKPSYCVGDLVIRSGSDDVHLYIAKSPLGTGNVKLLNLNSGSARFFEPMFIQRLALLSPFTHEFRAGDELELNTIYPKEPKRYCVPEFGNQPRSLTEVINHYQYDGSKIESYILALFDPNVKLKVHSIEDADRMIERMTFSDKSYMFGMFSKSNFQYKKKETPTLATPLADKIGYQVGDLVVHKDCRSPSLPSLCVEVIPFDSRNPYDTPRFKLVNIYDGDIHYVPSNEIYGLATPRKTETGQTKTALQIGDEIELSDFYDRCRTIFYTIDRNINLKTISPLDNFTKTLLLISDPKNKVRVCNLYPENRIRVEVQSDSGSIFEDFSANNFRLKAQQKEIESRPLKTIEPHYYSKIFNIKPAVEKKSVDSPRPNIFARKFQSIKEALERLL